MRRQPVLADIGAIDEARFHHVPAERALQPAEHENDCEPRQEARFEPAGEPEEQERDKKGDADEAAKQAMSPLPPID